MYHHGGSRLDYNTTTTGQGGPVVSPGNYFFIFDIFDFNFSFYFSVLFLIITSEENTVDKCTHVQMSQRLV